MAKESTLNFQIKGVEITHIEYASPSEKFPEGIAFNFDINVQHKINQDKKAVFVLVGISIRQAPKKEKILGRIEVATAFDIENFDDVVKENKQNVFSIAEGITDMLNSIAISTARGAMAATFRGTVLHNAILPVVQPTNLRKQ